MTNSHDERKGRETRKANLFLAGLACFAFLGFSLVVVSAQIPTDSWPTYHGDYSGRRYSTLKQVNTANVKGLTLAWVYRINTSRAGAIVGGEGPDTPPPGTPPAIKSTPLMVNGTLYFSVPDHVYAVDARTGRDVWHYAWKTRGGDHIGNRGVGILDNWLYFLTPDNYFISLDVATGKERWHHEIANMKREYFSTNAPMIIGRQVIIGVGGDALDIPGYLESRDPEAGNLIWRWDSTPKPGDKDAATWPDEDSMAHGGGMPWIPGTYDPELNLYYFGTGNPQPVLAGSSRPGDNLYTCTIVAINPNTGKMAWHYQVTPHDTHDWDAAQTPILIDGEFNGRPRKLIAQASRNGHYFLLDRATGEHLLTSKHIDSLNWTKGINAKGQPAHDPAKGRERARDAGLAGHDRRDQLAAAELQPGYGPAVFRHAPDVQRHVSHGYRRPAAGMGRGRTQRRQRRQRAEGDRLQDRQGEMVASLRDGTGRTQGGAVGLLSTAGGLLFGNDGGGNFVAYDAATGKPLWHAGLGTNTSNGPETFCSTAVSTSSSARETRSTRSRCINDANAGALGNWRIA
jgi:alcohol dehydrogenase (cytochrome c)